MTENKNRTHVNIKLHSKFRFIPFQQRQQAEEEQWCFLYTFKPTIESIINLLQNLGKIPISTLVQPQVILVFKTFWLPQLQSPSVSELFL